MFPEAWQVDGHFLPFTFVGDDAFPLREYLMRPYPCRDLKGQLLRVKSTTIAYQELGVLLRMHLVRQRD